MTTAFLFPGQGSQRIGMGRHLAERYPEIVGPLFRTADDALGIELSRLCWEGPEEELRRTEITQPAVYVVSLATLRVLEAHGLRPSVVAGHSLGEYTALVAAGVLDWVEALGLVRRRGLLMAAVQATTAGTMLAVIGPAPEQVEKICAIAQEASGEVVEVANYNDDTQTVVSGTVAGIAAFHDHAGGLEPAPRLVPLDVGAPFHCSLMEPVETEFAVDLAAVTFADPKLPVVANTTARPVTSGEEARAALRAQLAGSVRWRPSLTTVVDHGVDTFVEVGPGRVLSGLCRTTYPDLAVHATADGRRVDRTIQALRPATAH
ncbi:ACP S-malonyltransferase [Jiangella endophytica]|uniref:ACP S-malonyltransferase n=1 Tax=Jiangella endophytica TaxID=1623398 RepID=UPI000E34DDEE|nr:ACP S-malonyltransferase [Jiangella endophytica]